MESCYCCITLVTGIVSTVSDSVKNKLTSKTLLTIKARNYQKEVKKLQQISSWFTSIHGIITCIILVVGLFSSWLLRHDAKNIQRNNQINQWINWHIRVEQWIKIDSLTKLRQDKVDSIYFASTKDLKDTNRIILNNTIQILNVNENIEDFMITHAKSIQEVQEIRKVFEKPSIKIEKIKK